MENGSFIDGLPIKNGDFPWLCLKTRWYHLVTGTSDYGVDDPFSSMICRTWWFYGDIQPTNHRNTLGILHELAGFLRCWGSEHFLRQGDEYGWIPKPETKGTHTHNITGWWYTSPFEKYESQIGSSSQLLGKIKNVPNHQPDNYGKSPF